MDVSTLMMRLSALSADVRPAGEAARRDEGFAAVDALVALSLLSVTLILSLQAADVARRSALARIGGFAAIRGELIDDCSLAAKIKAGGSIRLDLADDSVSLRPYDDWQSLWNMIARSAYTQLHYSPLMLAGATLGMILTYLAPPVLALVGGAAAWPAWLAWILMAVSYRPMLRKYGQPAWLAPLLPVTALFYLGATLDSARRFYLRRGGQWKGRTQAPVRS